MRTCTACGESKQLDDFQRKGWRNGRQRRRSDCKTCVTIKQRAWRDERMQEPAYVRVERKRHRDYSRRRYHEDPAYRQRQKARKAELVRPSQPHGEARRRVRSAIEAGLLVPAAQCERCGHNFSEHRREGHHADYSQPLEVEWLCQPCHNREHRKSIPASQAPAQPPEEHE